MSHSNETSHSSEPHAPAVDPAAAQTDGAASAAAASDGIFEGAQSAPVDLKVVINALQDELAEREAKIAQMKDQLLRALADTENLRKRAEKEKADTAKYAITKFAREIVGVGDNFQRAVMAVPAGAAQADPALKSLIEGVTMTEREFNNVLERNGVRRIDPAGEIFNPHQHQAVMETENKSVFSGTILKVMQSGYMLEDRVLRPAMVMVARGGARPGKEADGAQSVTPDTHLAPQGQDSAAGDDTGTQ